jgi:hypothetical protein
MSKGRGKDLVKVVNFNDDVGRTKSRFIGKASIVPQDINHCYQMIYRCSTGSGWPSGPCYVPTKTIVLLYEVPT